MPTFVATHTWKEDDYVTVAGKVLRLCASYPEGVNLCAFYVHDAGAWSVYSADQDGATKIQEFFMAHVPEMTTTVTPVLTTFPPTVEIYPLIGRIMHAMRG